MSDRDKRRLMTAVIGLVGVWGVGLVALAGRDEPDRNAGHAVAENGARSPFRGGTLPPGVSGRAATRFVLEDARAGRVDTRQLTGRPYVVTFLYVNCKDVCPLIAVELRQALKQLGARGKHVSVLAVSADPRSDTRAAVRRWFIKLRMPDNFHYLIGSDAQLQPV